MDRGYEAVWFRNALIDMKITQCIPSRKNHKMLIPHDAVPYKKRHKIENMFDRMKDWRSIAMRFDRRADICLHTCSYRIVLAMSPEPRMGALLNQIIQNAKTSIPARQSDCTIRA